MPTVLSRLLIDLRTTDMRTQGIIKEPENGLRVCSHDIFPRAPWSSQGRFEDVYHVIVMNYCGHCLVDVVLQYLVVIVREEMSAWVFVDR